jgi:hypothetical protein
MAKRVAKKSARTVATVQSAFFPAERIESRILVIRGQRVMLDRDLAVFYGVQTGALNRAVKRNSARFPEDFCFQLSAEEIGLLSCQFGISKTDACDSDLRCQIGISNGGRGGRRYRPYVFTEHGALMAAAVLNSPRADQVSVLIIRAFVRLRHILLGHADLARRIATLERQFSQKTEEHEAHIAKIYEILQELMNPPEPPKKTRIGFVSDTITGAARRPPRVGSRTTAKFAQRLSGANR